MEHIREISKNVKSLVGINKEVKYERAPTEDLTDLVETEAQQKSSAAASAKKR